MIKVLKVTFVFEQVFMTEIDFITRTTSTSLIAEEKGEEIVQLSYLKQVRTSIETVIS